MLNSGSRPTDANLELSYKGLMLEVGFIGRDEHQSAESLLIRPDRAGAFARTRILGDPTGTLVPPQQEARRSYAKRNWVRARCDVDMQALAGGPDAMPHAPASLPRLLAVIQVAFGRSIPSEEQNSPLCRAVEHALREARRERGTG